MELNDIWAKVGDKQVFQGLSFRSNAKHLGIVGSNGAGKSSLLRLLQGLVAPQRGSVKLERPVGLVFQNPDHQILFPTVMEELSFGLTEKGAGDKDTETLVRDFASQHNATHLLELATHELSAGQKTLVCILSVLIDQPKTILLDESFANLDLGFLRQMTQLLQNSSARVVFSTHQTQVLKNFEEVIWLDQGSIRMQGPPHIVLEAYEGWSEGRVKPACDPHRANEYR